MSKMATDLLERAMQQGILLPDRSSVSERVAQYVRMSHDDQDHSPINQADAIAAYAVAHGFAVVQTYLDEGRSGLSIDGRPAFRQLLQDVQSGDANFSAILVYDVSRWGRFQDVDEGAYYEQMCKKAGVRVVYCSEDFRDDGSLASTLLKAVDRVEAAHYSRRLSIRVFAGHCTLSSRGFWQGAPAGYGLRRTLIDANGSPRAILSAGERKFIQSDRVVLTLGPPDEVAMVQRIFRSFAFDGKNEVAIARELNEEGHVNHCGRRWTRGAISHMLANEKYAGHNVYNRTTCKLKSKSKKNPPEKWIRSFNAFEPVVDPELFRAAQRRFEAITNRKSNQALLDDLKSLLASKGHLTSKLITKTEFLPCALSVQKRFGSLMAAYELIGYRPKNLHAQAAVLRETRAKRRRILSDVFAELRRAGLAVRFDWENRTYVLNDRYTLSIYILRCFKARGSSHQWILRQRRRLNPDLVVGVRLNVTNDGVHDYFLLRNPGLRDQAVDSSVNVKRLRPTLLGHLDELTQAIFAAIPAA
jgi:DNA invertase Pin-like site-specific DNA recombinase